MTGEDNFLSRWSRRKAEAREPRAPEPLPAQPTPPDGPPAVAGARGAAPAPAEPAPLPPIESLTPESDFSPFMGKDVDPGTRSKALRTLFADPHFNAMDMMDVYVDDYSKPDPLPPGWLEKLEQVSHLGDKAGRDREEAQRRRALEEAQAQEEQVAPDAQAPPDDPGTAAAAPPPERGETDAEPPAAEPPIPPSARRESGT